jgi:hypothetical protein
MYEYTIVILSFSFFLALFLSLSSFFFFSFFLATATSCTRTPSFLRLLSLWLSMVGIVDSAFSTIILLFYLFLSHYVTLFKPPPAPFWPLFTCVDIRNSKTFRILSSSLLNSFLRILLSLYNSNDVSRRFRWQWSFLRTEPVPCGLLIGRTWVRSRPEFHWVLLSTMRLYFVFEM